MSESTSTNSGSTSSSSSGNSDAFFSAEGRVSSGKNMNQTAAGGGKVGGGTARGEEYDKGGESISTSTSIERSVNSESEDEGDDDEEEREGSSAARRVRQSTGQKRRWGWMRGIKKKSPDRRHSKDNDNGESTAVASVGAEAATETEEGVERVSLPSSSAAATSKNVLRNGPGRADPALVAPKGKVTMGRGSSSNVSSGSRSSGRADRAMEEEEDEEEESWVEGRAKGSVVVDDGGQRNKEEALMSSSSPSLEQRLGEALLARAGEV